MNEGRARRFCAGIAVACVVALIAACGGNPPTPFTFTPVPYTIIAGPGGTPVALTVNDDGAIFVADELLVTVKLGSKQAFTDWAKSREFRVELLFDDKEAGRSSLLLKVPTGAVPAVLALVKERQEVVYANLSTLRRVY